MSRAARLKRLEHLQRTLAQRLPAHVFDARGGQRPKLCLNAPPDLDHPEVPYFYDPVPFPYTHARLSSGETVPLTALGFPDLDADPVYVDGDA